MEVFLLYFFYSSDNYAILRTYLMEKTEKELAEKIESGEYFAEAREWYLQRYLFNFIERSYLIVLLIGCGVLFTFALMYYEAIQPIHKNIPVQIRIQDPAEEYSRLIYLGNAEKKFNINNELMKFFSAKFVDAIESYDHKNNFKKLRTNLSYIKSLANEDIYNYYVNRISLRSRDSVILRYKRNLVKKINIDYRTIEIAEVKEENKVKEIFSDSADIRTYVATVNFEIEDITRQETKKSKWQAKVNIDFETIKYDFEKKEYNNLNYKVTGYESRKI